MQIFFTHPSRAADPPGLILSALQAAAQRRRAADEPRKR
jgi:hypothetical protein